MKKKIKITWIDGKTTEFEKPLPDPDFIRAIQLNHSHVFKDKTKYNRKQKHKKNFRDFENSL